MEEKSDIVRWINAQLKSHDYKKVTHLEAELADGITLLRLVQIVADEQLPRHFLRPVMRVQKIENLKLCLQFLQDRRVELGGVKAEDVANGDIQSILLLMQHLRQWQSTLTGQEEETSTVQAYESSAMDPIQSYSEGKNTASFSAMTKDDIAILNWVAQMVHKDMSSYSQMSSGGVLCSLVNRLSPGAVDIRKMLTASPIERVQMALVGAEHCLDVHPGSMVAQSFVDGQDPEKLRHYLQQLHTAHKHQLKRKEEQRPRGLKLQLEEEQDRYKTNERRLLQQQQRASERRKINLFDSQTMHSRENLNPVENLAHQSQREKEQQERTNQARNSQDQERRHSSYKARPVEDHQGMMKQVELAEMHGAERGERTKHMQLQQQLQEEQEKRDQLQKQRMAEERKKRLIDELKKREQIRQRRQAQQQTYLDWHKQQVTDSHEEDDNNFLSPSDIVRRAAASASGQLAETDSLLSEALRSQRILASARQKSLQGSISLIPSKRMKKGPRRRAVSMTDFRRCALDTIEEERKSSGSSTPSEERPLNVLDSLQRTVSEGDVRREGTADDYSIVPIKPVIMTAAQKDVHFPMREIKPPMSSLPPPLTTSDDKEESMQMKSGPLVVQLEQDDVSEATNIVPDVPSSGHRDSMPDVVEYSEERQEASGGWNEKLERRLLELEENNIKLEALLEQERNWRIRRTAKRRQTPARKREIKAFLDYFSMVAQLASHRIRDYDACMVTFSRRLSNLQSEVARLFEQFISKENEEIRFVRDELLVELNDKVKDLAKKVDSIDRGTLASSAHQSRMDPLTKKKKQSWGGKGDTVQPKTSRSLFNFGKGKRSYHQSYQQIDSSEVVEPSKFPSSVYSQSQMQLRQPDRLQRSGVQIQRRHSLYKLESFFGQCPPHDLHMFLDSLGYDCYANVFDREHVTMVELQHMNEEHLAQLGIPLGPRVVMMKALKELKHKE